MIGSSPSTESPRPSEGRGSRYFFSLRVGERVLPDREGVVLPPEVDLRQCALHLADRLRADDAISDLSLSGCAVEVTDSVGQHVVTIFVPPPGASDG